MLREDQIDVIREYVPAKYIDQEKLIRYLSLHDMVGEEVFNYVAIKVYKGEKLETILPIGFHESGFDIFDPVDVETFVRRIPFTFYHKGDDIGKDIYGKEVLVWRPLEIAGITYCVGSNPFSSELNHRDTPLTLEDAYQKMEFLFYEKGFSLEEIYGYTDTKTWLGGSEPYADWFDYLDMCMTLGWDDYMPKNFYYKYNMAKEALGKDPIIFPIMEFDFEAWARDPKTVKYYDRRGTRLEFKGLFPCGEDNNPVVRWIGVDIRNAASVTSSYDSKNELECHMIVELTPKTIVRAQIPAARDKAGNPLPEAGMEWIQVYAGPQTMTFNYKVIKARRTELGYTQQQVADAVCANVRTYQKWESGETTPDGYYLLKILNWLDIPSINDVITYEDDDQFLQ